MDDSTAFRPIFSVSYCNPLFFINHMFSHLLAKGAKGLMMGTAGASLVYWGMKSIDLPQVHASSTALPPPEYKWSHSMPWQGFDHARFEFLFLLFLLLLFCRFYLKL
jgi:hypothetical protein